MTPQLQTLLRLRQFEVDRCQSQLAAAIQREQTLLNHRRDIEAQQAQLRLELSKLTQEGPLQPAAWQLRQRHALELNNQRISLQIDIENAALATQQDRVALLAADQQRQVVEKLRERQSQQARMQQQRVADRELTEAWRPQSR